MKALAFAIALCFLPFVYTGETEALPVSFQFEKTGQQSTVPGIVRSSGDAAEPPPESESNREELIYQFAFLDGINEAEDLPLTLVYRDRQNDSGLGIGWTLFYRLGTTLELDLLNQQLFLRELENRFFLDHKGHLFPAEPVDPGEQQEAYKVVLDKSGTTGVFHKQGAQSLHLASLLSEDRPAVNFSYQKTGENNRLTVISSSDGEVKLHGDHHITEISLNFAQGQSAVILNYEILQEQDNHLLANIKTITKGADEQFLDFDYSQPALQRDDICEGPTSSLWQQDGTDDDPSSFLLPDGLNVRVHQGIEFMRINKDDPIDLVSTSDRKPGAWLGTKGQGWVPHPIYKLERDHIKAGRRLGSRFSGIWKDYEKPFKRKRDTSGFSSVIESFYIPDPDDPDGRLAYQSRILFPVVNANEGKIDQDEYGRTWDIDTSPALTLPVPLQYEGRAPFGSWPRLNEPTLKSLEHARNQGALLTEYQGMPAIQYAGLCYEDSETDAPLLAPHRCTGNCQPRYEEAWGSRSVKVSLCQAVWVAKSRSWAPDQVDQSESSFWHRVDLVPDQSKPTGTHILPWDDNKAETNDELYRYHLEGFRNVRFLSLTRDGRHALVFGKERIFPTAEQISRPKARVLLRFDRIRKRWVFLKDPSLLPPDDLLDHRSLFFLDMDDDGKDDLIVRKEGKMQVFRNQIGKGLPDSWRLCPTLQLPDHCSDFRACQFANLEPDSDPDLVVRDGSVIFNNLSRNDQGFDKPVLTSFPDSAGNKFSR